MSNIVQFVPKGGLTAQQNIVSFLDMCRNELTVFGADLAFDSHSWDVTKWVFVKAKKSAYRLNFSNWDTATYRGATEPMSEPFCSFAKAYIRYLHALRARRSYTDTMTALRVLEKALIESTGSCQPTNVDAHSLNRASQLLVDSLTGTSAYSSGRRLENIANFLNDLRLVAAPFSWKSWIKPAKDRRIRVGREFDKFRQVKMLSPAAFYALGHIFQNCKDPGDILVSCTCAILCAAPSRIAEVVLLPSLCEVNQVPGNDQHNLYGLRWMPGKGGAPMVKWVASPMHDIVYEALTRLRKLSEPGLRLARWYEENPTSLYLPAHLEHHRGSTALTMREVSEIVFEDSDVYYTSRPHQWCKTMGIKSRKIKNMSYVGFDDVEQAVLSMLPAGFPILDIDTGLRYQDALMVLRKNELESVLPNYRCMFQPVQPGDISTRIGTRKEVSIFEKHDLYEDNGSQIILSTHRFRHYLNTLAQANGIDQLDLARWSGRINVSQNAAYDHVSDLEATQKLRLALAGEVAAVGPIARLHRVALVPREQFARLRIPTAHTTDFGYCVHDFSMLPCQTHQDCINCTEHVCIKGETLREASIKAAMEEARLLLRRAQDSLSEEEYGSERWVEHHSLTLKRLESLCAIIDDPNVPLGAVIRLDDAPVVAPIEQATMLNLLAGGQAMGALLSSTDTLGVNK